MVPIRFFIPSLNFDRVVLVTAVVSPNNENESILMKMRQIAQSHVEDLSKGLIKKKNVFVGL